MSIHWKSWLLLSASLILSGCGAKTVDSQAESSGATGDATKAASSALQIQTEDYKTARSHFQTKIASEMPAPQEGETLRAPNGAQQVTYSTAPTLQAWISSMPPTSQKAKKRPAVLFLHGGFAMGASDWDMAKPYRDAGFLVMMPALRGENGQSGNYSMFYNEVNDVLAAGEYLAKQSAVDTSHIYIAGHSVGGTLVLLSTMTSGRFRAGASFSGSPDQIAWSKSQPEVIPFDPSDQKEFEMRSPLAYATSFKCPVRMYYGDEEDWCTVPSQRTATLAKAKSLDVEAVQIPGDHFSEVATAMKQSIEFFNAV